MKNFKLVLVLILAPLLSFAGVNLKNGNFYLTYTDINVLGGGHDLEISRTYNSKATRVGWFGFGWGSEFETNLEVGADGSVTINENGSGAKSRFVPGKQIDAKAAATKIVEAMRAQTAISGADASKLIEKLTNDEEWRQAYARKFNVKSQLASGTVLQSATASLETVNVLDGGYKRVFNSGRIEHYNKLGALTSVEDKFGYKIDLDYGKDDRLTSIKDTQAKQFHFEWYPNGLVKHIWTVDTKKTAYKYEGQDLVESKDVADNVFKYAYDKNHNMTSVEYSDKSKLQIAYYPQTQFVSKVTERNGEATEYKYESNPQNPDLHYWTLVTKEGISGKKYTNRYEYEMKTKADGSTYAYRILTEINGISTETVYSEQNSLPAKITRGSQVTTFKYNDKGLLSEKRSSSGEFVELKYHDKLNKVVHVKNNQGWTKFDYNGEGNLFKAINDQGKTVLLNYDRKGRIASLVDAEKNEKKVLSFEYNALGKPVEIVMKDVGKINVLYDNYGEIKKVESAQGHKMALQVTQAFQSLLSIVKPAGVDLNL